MKQKGSCVAVFKNKTSLKKALESLKKIHIDMNQIFIFGDSFFESDFAHKIIAEGLEEQPPPNGLSEIGNFLSYYLEIPRRFIVKYEQMLRESYYLLVVARLPGIERIKDILKSSSPLDIAVHI